MRVTAEILWKDKEYMSKIVVCMGAFHSMCNFLGTVGKIFKDTGLKDIAVDSAVNAKGWIEETNNSEDSQKQDSTHNEFADLQKCLTEEQFEQLLKVKSRTIVMLFNEFQNVLMKDNVDLTCFWMSYMDMVEILLIKSGHWRRVTGCSFWLWEKQWYNGCSHMIDQTV